MKTNQYSEISILEDYFEGWRSRKKGKLFATTIGVVNLVLISFFLRS